MATSAAPPWIGVLILARSAAPMNLWLGPIASGSCRYRPINVRVRPNFLAYAFVFACQSRTSGRASYHFSNIS